MNKTPSGSLCKLLCASLVLAMTLFCLSVPCTSMAVGQESSSAAANASSATGKIRIDNTTFSPIDNVSSHWSDGKGWKNLPGKYVALVDFGDSNTVISKDGGTLTLAVAGVNRIGTLKGNCSVNIVGTGIVLIDRIEIAKGNTLSLSADRSLYEEGSAAVFLQQKDGSYLLINGSIPGILDEEYQLDDVRLTVPKNASLKLWASVTRSETWYSYDEDDLVTDVTRYVDSIPDDIGDRVHDGEVQITGSSAKLTLGPNSNLTIANGASVQLKEIKKSNGLTFGTVASHLVVKGTLNVGGLVEGGLLDIEGSGSLLGESGGTIRSSKVSLASAATLSQALLLDGSALTVAQRSESVSATIKDSIIYLKGQPTFVKSLNVSGKSVIGVDTNADSSHEYDGLSNRIGDIAINPGGSLEILANDHPYETDPRPLRLLEDCILEISGKITGGTVSVLAGCVKYTGAQGAVPVVPTGYASRVLVDNADASSSEFPLMMTDETASERATSSQITIMRLSVVESLDSQLVLAREWDVDSVTKLESLTRTSDQSFTYTSFLDACDQKPSSEPGCWTAIEVIYPNFSRKLLWPENEADSFSTDGVVMIRILDCTSRGSQGGETFSHTETTFTGSGILGSTGNGSVTAGKSAVVFTQKASYTPTDPDDPDPIDPDPIDPDPIDPDPIDPDPIDPDDPDPDDPDPDDPDNRNDNGNGGNNGSGANGRFGNNGGNGGSGWGSRSLSQNGLTLDVTSRGNGRYTLVVSRGGRRLSSLNGLRATVTIQNPAGIMEGDTCYIVFENDEHGAWIPAQYDPTTRRLVFETDQVGAFAIARVSIEDVRLDTTGEDAPTYRRMLVTIGDDEVTDLPGLIRVEVSLAASEGGKNPYAVFVDEDESLHAFPIVHDGDTGKRSFQTDVTGSFVVVGLDSAPQSDVELSAACRACEEVRTLIAIMRLRSFWS